jgi:hypothetical protein
VSDTLRKVKALAAESKVRVSVHGYDELAADDIFFMDIMDGVSDAVLIEDYPHATKGPCVLVLQSDRDDRPVHVVWGIPARKAEPAVLVTAYRPDPLRWAADYRTRRDV